ncbi:MULTISPECIES: transcription-repair coupling factor [Idiomarina]|uniref:transcription-repair coupling factor n=1 Tax=Idiomarina TaxID=135575 RepID=UPI00129AAAE2|nr:MULTISPECIES: transcription-repair coupling factor [Idiomarina]MRJ41353.1 transcription-repair coupling factor [Idiomarina sp. FeN1]NCU56828.1 transcription-repair coupling factor [Idiomarina sp. FenA--70]NCU59537.1 transcription-repair coupling factor [Idiomarina sp. FenBw--71]UUN14193.1 transcription-repair coupling factor [Idiomarina loihiensis]
MTQVSIFSPPTPTSASIDLTWQELHGSSVAMALGQTIENHPGPVLIVTPDAPQAHRLEQEIAYFTPTWRDHLWVFPDWETLPYDSFSPHQDIISERLKVLAQLPDLKRGALIVSLNTLLHRVAPKDFVSGQTLQLSKGQQLDIHQLRQRLERAGYRHVAQVMEHGEFCVRGSLLDLFPMGCDEPYRLDFFDDELDSIRLFDPDTQLSATEIDAINLLPAHEFPTNETAIEGFRARYRDLFNASNERDSVYYQVSNKQFPGGIEYYQPLFFEQMATLFDYLPDNALLVTFGDIQGSLDSLWHDIQQRYEQRRYDPLRPLLAPHQVFMTVDQLHAGFKQLPRVRAMVPSDKAQPGPQHFATEALADIAVNHQLKDPLQNLRNKLTQLQQQQYRVLFLVESAGRRESLRELLAPLKLALAEVDDLQQFVDGSARTAISIAPVVHSFLLPAQQLAIITETELLGHRISQRRRKESQTGINAENMVRNLAELRIGQPVVHIDHGVGRYQGLKTLEAGGITTEFVTIEYAQQSILYVPVASLHVLSRYSGGEEASAPLHKLGNDQWEKAKRKAAEKIRDVAAELLDVYAKREAKPGYAFQLNQDDYRRFAASFPFEETDDQQQAIAGVLDDMQSNRAMDRLVCGDVGFGKTEVAMRAAFVAVNDGKQVAVLVPTTLLAQQHFENFKDRFADWPIRVEVLSRFKTSKQTKQILADLAAGKIDLVIGTHKLLSADVAFHDLGLLIVDEEHRFGVRQKEAIKRLRADVDILTLTATPIPRTLNMAMHGVRDLSIIATPPAKRLAVKTFVREYDEPTIREAVLREILRGGQVYFLHNNVETIEKTARELAELVPEARITVAHGQMRERELERIMSDFYHQRFNVLVCTTIVETGIDVPTANTIIMDRADHLGLAQMHQLRGRVGRSHHQAYAYLLTPHPKRMTKDALKRLEAISQLEDLGAGFMLATHDLEIRGAGELLGDEQSGQIESIGFTLYMEMLEQAVQAMRDGKEPALEQLLKAQAEVELRVPALLPEDYIGDVNIRLSLYKRIASANGPRELDEIQVELIDRFGLLPEPVKNLVRVTAIRHQAALLGLRRIEGSQQGISLEFGPDNKVQPAQLIELIQSQPNVYKLDGPNRLRILMKTEDTQARLKLVESLLEQLLRGTE